MGLETKTIAVKGTSEFSGKLHLDSKELKFSSKAFKWSMPLGAGVKANATGTRLVVSRGRDKVTFEIGDKVDRWVEKILNPPGLLDKLGVKPEMKCWLSKGFANEFKEELRERGAKITRNLDGCELAFFRIDDRGQLGELLEVGDALADKVNMWVVYPRGVEEIKQGDVMTNLKKIGFGPGKTAAFDERLSSMRYARRN